MSAAYDARKGELSALRHQLHQMIDEFKKEKKEELRKLGEERKRDISALKKRVGGLRQDVHDSLTDFRKTALAEIRKGAEDRRVEVSGMLKDFRKEVLEGYRHEFSEMACAWKELVASMKAKRAGQHAEPYIKAASEKTPGQNKKTSVKKKTAKKGRR